MQLKFLIELSLASDQRKPLDGVRESLLARPVLSV